MPVKAVHDADIIILGGGCAGLSLAAHLAQPGRPPQRILILEARTDYADDRTFSGWRALPHPFQSCVRASWQRWRVAQGHRVIERGMPGLFYETIRSSDFYSYACRLIARTPGLRLILGISSGAVFQTSQGAWVETDQGRLSAELIVDTRPLIPVAGAGPDGGLLQVFTGCEIESSRAVFDPAAVELMMFDPPAPDHIGFCYALPFTPYRALLEYTRFTVKLSEPPTMTEVVERITARIGEDFSILRTESGTLEMRVKAPRHMAGNGRVLRLGTLGGAARASTGYAFGAIQQQAASLAARLRYGWPAARGWQAPMPPAWMREMDRLFLRVLRRDPRNGPFLLAELFDRCPPAPLTRFLSGQAGLADAAKVAMALPTFPFLRTMLL